MTRWRGRRVPEYNTPEDFTCPECGLSYPDARIVALFNDFDHQWGTEFPLDWGSPVCSECETAIGDYHE